MNPWAHRPPAPLSGQPSARSPFSLRGLLAAVALPGVATLVGVAAGVSSAAAVSLYILAVAATAAAGGLWSGVAGAILSFLGLNYYFTVPFHTFRVQKAEDLVALVVFVVVGMLVAALLARTLSERDRAERREAETQLLNRLATKLLAGTAFDVLLREIAQTLVRVFGLTSCEIELRIGPYVLRERAKDGGEEDEGSSIVEIPLRVEDGRDLGLLRVRRSVPVSEDERHLLETFAGQLALAGDRARADDEARRARLEAETSQLRAALFSSVTHDLRTPLASIKASVTSLLDPAVGHGADQRGDLLRTILEETDRLNRLVGNILDLARMRAGALTPNRQRMGVEEVLETAAARMQGVLAGFRVQLSFRPNLPEAWIDPVQIDQVMSNLLENAARFSPPGSDIRISAWNWQSAIEVKVSDQGPGIGLGERSLVFEPFYRRDAGPGRGGTGLGLAIARAIVVVHGGEIRIEETPGGGHVRHLSAAYGTTRSEGWRRIGVGGHGVITALVVDDEPQIVRALRTALSASGYEVVTASTGQEGLAHAAAALPDVVILDLGLPDMDGTDVVKRLREWSDVPVIVLSVREGQRDKVGALDAGADDYVTKPFAVGELLARMRAAQRRAGPKEDLPETLAFGSLTVDLERRLVSHEGTPVHLTRTEYALLEVMVTNPGKLLTHEWLLRRVWGPG